MKERLVTTTMRNEGPFILEWVAWYRMLGFDHLVVFYNDCTDHSPELLEALDAAGVLTAVSYTPNPDLPVKRTSLKLMAEHPRIRAAEWVFNIDVDEFLVIHKGEGRLQDLFDAFPIKQVHAIAVHWRCFGDGGYGSWEDTLTHRRFTRASLRRHKGNVFFKTLIRWPNHFWRFGVHSPKGWRGHGEWGTPPNVMKRCDGATLRRFHPKDSSVKMTQPRWITHEYAQLNHYASRTFESFALKMGTLSSAANKDRYTETFFKGKNRNEELDEGALKYADRFDAVYAELTALPDVMRLHHLCCMDYIERLAEVHGFVAEDDPRWQHHRNEVAARTVNPAS
ncbi:MAG: glycosyltransferase family 2 protein [Rhodobacteraceae bacterium]|uniref:glycosyltransferase family 2 protein n=1 Tax=Celeribacter sp. HF31 TaxID=2721558 RepID=UPI001430301F|nr:glycosyltransferase family 2 protein [Celeribacter sp. HF31]NVK47955.1 glycosyltransferase family 2 protein [Paracoccaceae bacterium]